MLKKVREEHKETWQLGNGIFPLSIVVDLDGSGFQLRRDKVQSGVEHVDTLDLSWSEAQALLKLLERKITRATHADLPVPVLVTETSATPES